MKKKSTRVTRVTPKKKIERKPQATPDWPDRFIEALSEWPNVTRAAKAAFVSRVEVYRTRREDSEFAKRWDEAFRLGVESLQDEGIQIALTNPTMMIFMLKNLKPDVYSDKHVLETWQDRVIALLHDRKVTVEDVAIEFGPDIASDLAFAAGISLGTNSEVGTEGRAGESNPGPAKDAA